MKSWPSVLLKEQKSINPTSENLLGFFNTKKDPDCRVFLKPTKLLFAVSRHSVGASTGSDTRTWSGAR